MQNYIHNIMLKLQRQSNKLYENRMGGPSNMKLMSAAAICEAFHQ